MTLLVTMMQAILSDWQVQMSQENDELELSDVTVKRHRDRGPISPTFYILYVLFFRDFVFKGIGKSCS